MLLNFIPNRLYIKYLTIVFCGCKENFFSSPSRYPFDAYNFMAFSFHLSTVKLTSLMFWFAANFSTLLSNAEAMPFRRHFLSTSNEEMKNWLLFLLFLSQHTTIPISHFSLPSFVTIIHVKFGRAGFFGVVIIAYDDDDAVRMGRIERSNFILKLLAVYRKINLYLVSIVLSLLFLKLTLQASRFFLFVQNDNQIV